jgi:hypothetical protein
MHTKFHKDWFMHSEVNKGDTQTQRKHGDHIRLLLFFQNKESGLKITYILNTFNVCNQMYNEKVFYVKLAYE